MTRALTRTVPRSLADGERTHLQRALVDLGRARAQHAAYEAALAALGCAVTRLPELLHLPDSVFVEDVAVVLPELAVLTRPGAASRREEVHAMADALRPHRPLRALPAPATLDGGDVLRLGRTLYVGRSARSNDAGRAALAEATAPFGYTVQAVALDGCLHLKTAVTAVAEGLLLHHPAWVDASAFTGYEAVAVHPEEPFAANALRIRDVVLFPAAFPRTAARLRDHGLTLQLLDVDELGKAEAGLTCCSLLL